MSLQREGDVIDSNNAPGSQVGESTFHVGGQRGRDKRYHSLGIDHGKRKGFRQE